MIDDVRYIFLFLMIFIFIKIIKFGVIYNIIYKYYIEGFTDESYIKYNGISGYTPRLKHDYDIDKLSIGVFGGFKVKFFTPVVPGTLVYLHGELDWTMGSASSLKVKAYNGDTVFAKGTVTVAMANKNLLTPTT